MAGVKRVVGRGVPWQVRSRGRCPWLARRELCIVDIAVVSARTCVPHESRMI